MKPLLVTPARCPDGGEHRWLINDPDERGIAEITCERECCRYTEYVDEGGNLYSSDRELPKKRGRKRREEGPEPDRAPTREVEIPELDEGAPFISTAVELIRQGFSIKHSLEILKARFGDATDYSELYITIVRKQHRYLGQRGLRGCRVTKSWEEVERIKRELAERRLERQCKVT